MWGRGPGERYPAGSPAADRGDIRPYPRLPTALTLGGRKMTLKCTFHPSQPIRMEGTSTVPDKCATSSTSSTSATLVPPVPPTPPVPLSALLAREDLELRHIAGLVEQD